MLQHMQARPGRSRSWKVPRALYQMLRTLALCRFSHMHRNADMHEQQSARKRQSRRYNTVRGGGRGERMLLKLARGLLKYSVGSHGGGRG